MIDTKNQYELAKHVTMLKQGNVHLFNFIGTALSAIADPEMRRLLSVPRETIQVQQGRAQMVNDLLEVWYRCDQIVAPVRPAAPAGEPARWDQLLQNGSGKLNG